MARLVIGLGTSHSPMVATGAPMWEERAISDHTSPELYDLDGNHCTYDELLRSGKKRESECRPKHLARQAHEVQSALDRLADELREARPDVVLIVGDDQHELFDLGNNPAVAIFYGRAAVTRSWGGAASDDRGFLKVLSEGYMTDPLGNRSGGIVQGEQSGCPGLRSCFWFRGQAPDGEYPGSDCSDFTEYLLSAQSTNASAMLRHRGSAPHCY
jgi:hypothetical protein